VSNEQATDDPSGEGWRDVEVGEVLRHTDMFRDSVGAWVFTENKGLTVGEGWDRTYRRRIEPQQPSDSEPETMEQLRKRLDAAVRQNVELADELANEQNKKGAYKAILKRTMERAREAEALVAEAERSGQQVNAELQQLREQVTTLTRERDRYRNQLAGAIEHSSAAEAQAQLVDRLQKWLKPVLEVVADHPEDCRALAVAVLGYLPGIASRLIEE
jgi:broad specificity phosphatase PhoE